MSDFDELMALVKDGRRECFRYGCFVGLTIAAAVLGFCAALRGVL